MMLVISPSDFRKLSTRCQQELLAILTRDDGQVDALDEPDYPNDLQGSGPEIGASAMRDTSADATLEERRVVDIDLEEAHMLISNIGDDSLQTLRLFALGQPVALEDLVGPDRPYRDYAYLKRSFVGAVNRRLRTVMKKQDKNRSAMLFGRTRGDRIRITPRSAASLRQAFNIPEPLPIREFLDSNGSALPNDTESVMALRDSLTSAWKDFDGRPKKRQAYADRIETARYLIAKGFQARLGALVEHDEESAEFILSDEPPQSWLERVDESGDILLVQNGHPIWPADIYISSEATPGVLTKLES